MLPQRIAKVLREANIAGLKFARILGTVDQQYPLLWRA